MEASQFLTICVCSLQHLDEHLGHEGYGTYLRNFTPLGEGHRPIPHLQ